LETGGLAVVGSRHVDDALINYTTAVGRLAARSGKTLVSGGAKGIDQAAMRGALEAGGKVIGVLAGLFNASQAVHSRGFSDNRMH
jgi:predicted Rossmann fold nucleotide-binding protein DprA/Smf involved in DNA uptake